MVAYLLGAGVAADSRHPGLGHLALYRRRSGWWRSRPWRCPCCGAHGAIRARAALLAIFGVTFVAGAGLQPLFPAAGSADADQRHGLADGRPGRWCWWRRARRYGGRGLAVTGRPARWLLFAYNVWSLAPLRGLDSAWQRAIERLEREADPDAHRLADARFRLGDGLWLAALGQRRARRRRTRPCAAGQAQVQVDRLHRPGAAPSRLERRAAGRRPARARSIARWSWATTCWSCGCGTWIRTSSRSRPAWWPTAAASPALRGMLHSDYIATPAFTDPVAGAVRPPEAQAGPLGLGDRPAGNLGALHLPWNGPASWIARCLVQRLSQNAIEPACQRNRQVNSGRCVIHQEVEQRTALLVRHALEPAGIGVVHEQAFAAGFRRVRTTGCTFSVGRQLASSRTLLDRRALSGCGPATLMSLCSTLRPAASSSCPRTTTRRPGTGWRTACRRHRAAPRAHRGWSPSEARASSSYRCAIPRRRCARRRGRARRARSRARPGRNRSWDG